MAFFDWSDDFSTGIEKFDDDHKYLFNKVNELHSGLKSGFKISDMTFILDDLANYTKTHFAREESLMVEYGYPEYETHKAIHEKLLQKVADFQDRLAKGDTVFSLELLSFLKDWLTEHILKTDRKYGPFFQKAMQ